MFLTEYAIIERYSTSLRGSSLPLVRACAKILCSFGGEHGNSRFWIVRQEKNTIVCSKILPKPSGNFPASMIFRKRGNFTSWRSIDSNGK